MSKKFEIEEKLNLYIEMLLKRLSKLGQTTSFDVVKNASIIVSPQISSDRWDGGQYGHGIVFSIPPEQYLEIIDNKQDVEIEISQSLNKIYPPPNESVEEVHIVPLDVSVNQEFQLKCIGSNICFVSDEDEDRVWSNKDLLKIFISHRDTHKKYASKIRDTLLKFNVSSFVAHQDIEPTEEWVKEIKIALASMDVFIAFMTDDFFDSLWTNQEIGIAIALGIPIIPIKKDIDPKGFLSILQALPYKEDSFAKDLLNILLIKPRITQSIKNKIIDGIILSLKNASSWANVEKIAILFDSIEKISEEQCLGFIEAFNENSQFNTCISQSGYDAYGNHRRQGDFQNRINAWSEREYVITKTRQGVRLEPKPPTQSEFSNVPF